MGVPEGQVWQRRELEAADKRRALREGARGVHRGDSPWWVWVLSLAPAAHQGWHNRLVGARAAAGPAG